MKRVFNLPPKRCQFISPRRVWAGRPISKLFATRIFFNVKGLVYVMNQVLLDKADFMDT